MIVEQRMWHTADRKRLVPDGDLEAAFLAFTPGQEVPDALASEAGLLPAPVQPKARAKPGDKSGQPARNKSVSAASPPDGEV